jgi:competence protein ComEC
VKVRGFGVTFWDVGQGDCSTITLPDGRLIIIDVGPRGSPLIDWLHDKPRQIHAVVLTHNDSDHVGALPALVGSFKDRIQNFYMLVDRPTNDKIFDKTFRCALEGERLRHYQIQRLEAGAVVWKDSNLNANLVPVFPNMSGNVLASTPNKTSGILCLNFNGKTEIIWPGDSELGRVANKCSDTKPFVLFGPHHGAPADYKKAIAPKAINAVGARRAFISVGTKNKHSHPRPKYLQLLERGGCRLVCSQITNACDPNTVRRNRSVMATHLGLGLRPPRSGVSCRGAWQIYWNGSSFETDLFDEEHLNRISDLRRPQCLRGRAYAENLQTKVLWRITEFFKSKRVVGRG